MTEEPELGFEIFEEEGDGLSFMGSAEISGACFVVSK